MELGQFKVYFVQYKSKAGHWITSNRAYGSLAEANRGLDNVPETADTRIVEQTTCNRLV